MLGEPAGSAALRAPDRLRHPGRRACTTTSRSPRTSRSSPACSAPDPPRSTQAIERGRPRARTPTGRRPAQRRPALAGQPGRRPARYARTCWSSTSRPSASTRCSAATSGTSSTDLADDGAAVFVSSHVMDEAERCDRLLLMREGAIIADDTPDRDPCADPAPTTSRAPSWRWSTPRARGARHEPPDHPRRRHPGAHPAAPRPPHVGMLLVLPCVLITLLWWMFKDIPGDSSTGSARRCSRCSRSS